MLLDGKVNEIVEGYNNKDFPHRDGMEGMVLEKTVVQGHTYYLIEWSDGWDHGDGSGTIFMHNRVLRRKRPPGQLDEIIRKAKEPEHVEA